MISNKTFFTILSFTTVIYADLHLFESDNVECNKSSIDYNIVFKHGHHAGRFQKAKNITDMPSCIGKCCVTRDCDVAFMSRDNCYMVDCHNIESCVTRHLTSPVYETLLAFVSRPSKSSKNFISTKDGEPAVEENLQENSPQMDDTFEFKTNQNDKLAVLKQYSPKISRARRSEAIDILVAVAASLIAIIAAVIVIFSVMKRLVDRGDRAKYEVIE